MRSEKANKGTQGEFEAAPVFVLKRRERREEFP